MAKRARGDDAELFWAARFGRVGQLRELLQPLLTQANYDSVVHLIIDAIVGRVEAMLMQKRFNQLGALQLDKEVRGLVSQTSNLTERTVRDKFARLSHISTALNLDSPAEILDYWGDNAGTMNWRLTGREVKQVLLDLGHSREQVTRAFLDEAMAEMDGDGSGEVSFEEFREWWNKQLTQQVLEHHGTDRDPHEEYLKNYWSKADADGSGILDRDELQGLMARLGRLLQEEELDVAFAIMDEDGSGGIEYGEFRNWFEWLQAEDLTIGRLHADPPAHFRLALSCGTR